MMDRRDRLISARREWGESCAPRPRAGFALLALIVMGATAGCSLRDNLDHSLEKIEALQQCLNAEDYEGALNLTYLANTQNHAARREWRRQFREVRENYGRLTDTHLVETNSSWGIFGYHVEVHQLGYFEHQNGGMRFEFRRQKGEMILRKFSIVEATVRSREDSD